MDPQMLQIIKDAATVIQALLDERMAMQQQMMAQMQQQPQRPQEQEQGQKTASLSLGGGFSFLVADEFTKSASSDDDDAQSRFAKDEAYLASLVNNR